MKSIAKKQAHYRPALADVRADILRSAIASFRIEKITISPQQAASAMQKVEAILGKSTR